MAQHAWGIDIGDGILKAIRLKADGRALKVVRAIEIPYLDPFLKKKTPPCILDRRAIAALYQFGNTVKISETDRVALGFTSFHAFERVIEIPRVEESQREEMIHYEVTSRINKPLRNLKISHLYHRVKSSDMDHVFVHVVEKKEFEAFQYYIHESGIPYDLIVPSSSGLVNLAQLCVPQGGDLVILSPGITTTTLVFLKKGDYWARTLPVGLPAAPGRTLEVARDKIQSLCDVMKREIPAFESIVFPDKKFKPAKVVVSGEGGRVPGFINALDAALPAPVEVLNVTSRINTAPEDSDFPEDPVVFSMGKAIGLAAGALAEERPRCLLAGPLPRRGLLKEMPLLTCLAGLILVMALGMTGLEWMRSKRLSALENSMGQALPVSTLEEMALQEKGIDELQAQVKQLESIHGARALFPGLGKLLARLERQSTRRTFGDFQLKSLAMDYETSQALEAVVATRRGREEEVRRDLTALFQPMLDTVVLEGPMTAEEENPPAGLSPLVLYKVEGKLR